MTRHLPIVLLLIFAVWGAAIGQGMVEIVPFGGVGAWGDEDLTHPTLWRERNRLVSVLEGPGSASHVILKYDGSTNAIEAKLEQPPPAARVLDVVVSETRSEVFINYGNRRIGQNREDPLLIQGIDLNQFSLSATRTVEARIHRLDIDQARDRLIGIGEQTEGATQYEVIAVSLSDFVVSSLGSTGRVTQDFLIEDVVFDPINDKLHVLYARSRAREDPPRPNSATQEAVVVGYSAEDGQEMGVSPALPYAYGPQSLALSPNGGSLAVVKVDTPSGDTFVLDPVTYAVKTSIRDEDIAPGFAFIASGYFPTEEQLWLPNSSETHPEETIAVYNLESGTVERFISGAFRSLAFAGDPDLEEIFVASEENDSLYFFRHDSVRLTTELDLAVVPHDLAFEPIGDNLQILTKTGQLHLVTDPPTSATGTTPHYLARLLGFGDRPVGGLVVDPERERLYVGSQRDRRPRVLETINFTNIGELPTPADGFTLDASRNLIYTAYIPFLSPMDRAIRSINGDTFVVEDVIADLSDVMIFGDDVYLEIDSTNQVLWLAIEQFPESILRVYDLANTATASTQIDRANIYGFGLIEGTNRAFAAVTDGDDPEIQEFLFSNDMVAKTGHVDLDGTLVDFDLDPDHELGYALSFIQTSTESYWQLYAIELSGASPEIHSTHRLDFVRDNVNALLGFNETTNRFAISTSPDAKVYLFDNPVDPARRPPPGGGGKANVAITGEVVQATAGIEFEWTPPALSEGEIRGWVIERRLGLGSEAGPDEDWIRLNPVPLPAPFTFWNDTTVVAGATYEYRIRANLLGAARVDPLVLSPVLAASGDSAWRATIPEVTVFVKPGECRNLLVSVSPALSSPNRVHLSLAGSPEIQTLLSRNALPKPGTARLSIGAATDAPTGTYVVVLQAADSVLSARVPLLVRVVKPTQEVQTDRISRAPTTVTLTSDADLDAARISVRGQLGILRRLANPTGIFVSAQTPAGEVLTATGVVAPTGEFTAEIPVPATTQSGEFLFRATWPGSLDAVGGSSLVFNFPLVGEGANKQTPAALPPHLGQAIVVRGEPAAANQSDGLVRAASRVLETLVNRRFSTEENGTIKFETSPTQAKLKEAVGNLQSSTYALIYLLGDAVDDRNTGFAFKLNDQETLTPMELHDLVNDVTAKAKPVVVVDTPYAAKFQPLLEPLGGAGIFSAAEKWPDVSFAPGIPVFSNTLMSDIRSGYSLKDAFIAASRTFNVFVVEALSRNPQHMRVDETPFASLKLGSSFTAPRELVVDRIPPEFLELAPTETFARGATVPLMARTLDAPFDEPVSVKVEVVFPDGSSEIVPLASHRSPVPNGGEIHEGTFTARRSGTILTVYHAEDSTGTLNTHATTVLVGGANGYWVGAVYLLDTLDSYSTVPSYRFGSIVDRAYRIVQDWMTWVEE